MTFSHFNRRLHLYLGLGLLSWFVMYGVSSIPWAHSEYFNERDHAKGLPRFTLRTEVPFDGAVPEDAEEQRAFAASLLEKAGVSGPNMFVGRPNEKTFLVISYSFLKNTRVVYHIDQKSITVEDRRFRPEILLANMHARGGFEQENPISDSWGIIVDLVGVSIIMWIASGFYMWWRMTAHRRWGWFAILAGAASFALFTFGL